MGDGSVDELEIEKNARAHVQRIVAALSAMSINDVRQLIDEMEASDDPDAPD